MDSPCCHLRALRPTTGPLTQAVTSASFSRPRKAENLDVPAQEDSQQGTHGDCVQVAAGMSLARGEGLGTELRTGFQAWLLHLRF